MVLDPRTKKYLKIFAVIALVFIFTGCTSNVDKSGHLLASRAITESTPWSLKAGFFDFYLTSYDQVYYFYTEDADASARNGKNPEQISW